MFMMEPTAMLDHEKPFCCGAMIAICLRRKDQENRLYLRVCAFACR